MDVERAGGHKVVDVDGRGEEGTPEGLVNAGSGCPVRPLDAEENPPRDAPDQAVRPVVGERPHQSPLAGLQRRQRAHFVPDDTYQHEQNRAQNKGCVHHRHRAKQKKHKGPAVLCVLRDDRIKDQGQNTKKHMGVLQIHQLNKNNDKIQFRNLVVSDHIKFNFF